MRYRTSQLLRNLLVLLFLWGCEDKDVKPEEDLMFLAEPIVTLNPYDISPLSAVVSFESNVPVSATVTVTGTEVAQYSLEYTMLTDELPIVGLYPDTVNIVEIDFITPGGQVFSQTFDIETEALPDFFPQQIEIVSRNQGLMEPGWNLLTTLFRKQDDLTLYPYPIIFDNEGVIRWYLNLEKYENRCLPFEPSQDGNFLLLSDNLVIEIDVLGQEVNRWVAPEKYKFHHDVIEKPDGNLIVAAENRELETVDDFMVELDRATSAVVTEWDLREILDIDRYDFIENELDWVHVNAVWYDEVDDALIISGRNQGVFKVGRENDLRWILAPHQGWGKSGVNGDGFETSDYLLTAVDSDGEPHDENVQVGSEVGPDGFDWVWGQHAPLILEDGNYLIFDNGLNRFFTGAVSQSRGVEYHIDESNMTVQQVWEWGKERQDAFFSRIISDVDVLPLTGNRIVFSGIQQQTRQSFMVELAHPSNQVVFEAAITYQSGVAYRGERVDLSAIVHY